MLEFDTTGAGPPSNTPIKEFPVTTGNESPCRIGIDQSGKDLYTALAWSNFSPGGPDAVKYVNGAFDSVLTAGATRAIAVDQSTPSGHIFTAGENTATEDQVTRLREYEPCATSGCAGTEVPGSPFGHELIGAGMGVAHSATSRPPKPRSTGSTYPT